MKRPLYLLIALAGCQQTPVQTPTRSLDRPSDVALVCAAWTVEHGTQMLPLAQCNRDSTMPVFATGDGGADYGTLFSLITNTTRGELALAVNDAVAFNHLNATAAALVDLDPLNPDYGFLPVGANPVHVRATDDGCRAVTANADSCDLAVVDVPALISTVAGDRPQATYLSSFVTRVQPKVGGVPITARPTWIEIRHGGGATTCDAGAYTAWVAFPGCELIAEIGLADGEAVRAVHVGRDGAQAVDLKQGVRCPAECAGAPTDGGVAPISMDAGGVPDGAAASDGGTPSDGGAPSDGGVQPLGPTSQAYPQSFALDDANHVMYVGDALSDNLTIVPLTDAGFGAATQLTLADQPGGVQLVRLSPLLFGPDEFDSGGNKLPDSGVRYLYAIARDRTVRVVRVDQSPPTECETNPDIAELNAKFPIVQGGTINSTAHLAKQLRCLTVGAQRRDPTARTPGISLPGGGLPRDVAFTHVQRAVPSTNIASAAQPGVLVGDFAFIIDSNGHADTVNLVDQCPQPYDPTRSIDQTQECFVQNGNGTTNAGATAAAYAASVQAAQTLPGHPVPVASEVMPNRLRVGALRFPVTQPSPGDQTGPPRISDSPTVERLGTPLDVIGDPTVPDLCDVPVTGTSDGGVVAPVGCLPRNVQGTSGDPLNYIAVRDPDAVHNETWSFSWEGAISGTVRSTGTLTGAAGGTPPRLSDIAASYCLSGIEAGDKLFVTGCADDSGCAPDQVCYHDPGAPDATEGLCLPRGDATAVQICAPWTQSVRRWRITSVRVDAFDLAELPEPDNAIDTHECDTNADCDDVKVAGFVDNVLSQLPTSCLATLDQPKKHCLRACDHTKTHGSAEAACGAGYVCATHLDAQGNAVDDRCLRSPLPPAPSSAAAAKCFGGLVSYQVHAGDAFAVTAGLSSFPSPWEADRATGACVPSPRFPPDATTVRLRVPVPAPSDEAVPVCEGTVQADWLAPRAADTPNVCRLVLPGGPCATQADCTAPDTSCKTFARGVQLCSDETQYLRYDNPAFSTVMVVPARVLGAAGATDAGVADGGAPAGVVTHVPDEDTVVSLTLVGGWVPLSGPLATDVQAQLPRAAQVGPDLHRIYVVDEASQGVGTGLRGQLIRFDAQSQSTDTAFVIR